MGTWCTHSSSFPPYHSPAPVPYLTTHTTTQQGPPPGSPGPPAAPPPEEAPAGPARPAWRVVHKRPERTGHGKKKASAGASPAAPQAAIEAPKPDLPAWAQWRRELFHTFDWLEGSLIGGWGI